MPNHAGVVITHPDRIVFPDQRITKHDIADYYAAVMQHFLPVIKRRSTSVLRLPEVIGAAGFFQKHPMQGLKHVGHSRLKEASGDADDYLCPRDEAAVMELRQRRLQPCRRSTPTRASQTQPLGRRRHATRGHHLPLRTIGPAPD